MLSARRDRLALVTQLLVPIALVLVALWARQATDAFPQEPALDISRYAVLLLLHFRGPCAVMVLLDCSMSVPTVRHVPGLCGCPNAPSNFHQPLTARLLSGCPPHCGALLMQVVCV